VMQSLQDYPSLAIFLKRFLCVDDTVGTVGTLSKDNADGDGNATRSGKSQKVHCA